MKKHIYFAHLAKRVLCWPLWVDIVTYPKEKKNGTCMERCAFPPPTPTLVANRKISLKSVGWKIILYMTKPPYNSFMDIITRPNWSSLLKGYHASSAKGAATLLFWVLNMCVWVYVCVGGGVSVCPGPQGERAETSPGGCPKDYHSAFIPDFFSPTSGLEFKRLELNALDSV